MKAKRAALGNLPDILSWLSVEDVEFARSDVVARGRLLSKYRSHVVEPAVSNYDQEAYASSLSQVSWPYLEFQPFFEPLPKQLLGAPWSKDSWVNYTVWSLARATGRWPS